MYEAATDTTFGARATRAGDVAVVSVRGEVDLSTGPRLEAVTKRALRPPPGALLVDLDECPFMDSTGLNFLLRMRAAFPGRLLVSCEPGSAVARMLQLTSRGIIDVFDSADEAIVTWRGAATA